MEVERQGHEAVEQLARASSRRSAPPPRPGSTPGGSCPGTGRGTGRRGRRSAGRGRRVPARDDRGHEARDHERDEEREPGAQQESDDRDRERHARAAGGTRTAAATGRHRPRGPDRRRRTAPRWGYGATAAPMSPSCHAGPAPACRDGVPDAPRWTRAREETPPHAADADAGSPLPGYPVPPATMTDLYQLTMAYGYWKARPDRGRGGLHLLFRQAPFGGGFAVAAGLARRSSSSSGSASAPTTSTTSPRCAATTTEPLFEPAFLDYLADLRSHVRRRRGARGHGRLPARAAGARHGPAARRRSSLETPLLNLINFQTLIATKAARVCSPRGGDAGARVRAAAGAGDRRRPRRLARGLRRRLRRDLERARRAGCSASRCGAPTPTAG